MDDFMLQIITVCGQSGGIRRENKQRTPHCVDITSTFFLEARQDPRQFIQTFLNTSIFARWKTLISFRLIVYRSVRSRILNIQYYCQ